MSGHLRFCFAAFVLLGSLSTTSASSYPFSALFNTDPAPAAAPAPAEVGCLARPGKPTADGRHWVYRIEGRRRCWFEAAEGTETAKKSVRHRVARHRVAASEERKSAAYKRKAAVDARAELQRSAPEATSQPGPSAPVRVADADPVVATGIATRMSPAFLSKRANDQLAADEITPRQVDVEALLAATPADEDVVTASLAFSTAEASDDGRGWTWLGALLMILGLVSLLSASGTIRWTMLLHQLRSSFAGQRLLQVKRDLAERCGKAATEACPYFRPNGVRRSSPSSVTYYRDNAPNS